MHHMSDISEFYVPDVAWKSSRSSNKERAKLMHTVHPMKKVINKSYNRY